VLLIGLHYDPETKAVRKKAKVSCDVTSFSLVVM